MKLKLFCFSLVLLLRISVLAKAQDHLGVSGLRCEQSENPAGVEMHQPRLSWQIATNTRNVNQTAYQVLVADSPELLHKNQGNFWNSRKVLSNASVLVPYSGKVLASAKKYYWKVKVWDNKGRVSGWSKPAVWQMGLLSSQDWGNARWIAYEELPAIRKIIPAVHGKGKPEWGNGKNALPLLRKVFKVKKQLSQATLFISGLGHFDMSVNGKKAGDHFLDPGWTNYDKHALYVTFDLTRKLKQGDNVLGVMLGNGFYYIPRERYRKLTGAYGYPKMICRLLLEYKDGSTENIISDESWKTASGPVTFSSIYGGEDYNASLEQKGWDKPAFDDGDWKQVLLVDGPPELHSQTAQPLKVVEQLSAKKITQVKPGVWVYDLGQNASAIPAIWVKGRKGTKVKLIPGELLNKDSTVTQSASGGPHYYEYTLKGDGLEKWQPQFTYYGFRYIQMEGAVPRGKSNPDNHTVMVNLKSLHVRNVAERMGHFASSGTLFNRTNSLIDWAIKSNMASVFTDCPHREKLGWLEEVHLMGSSIQYNYNIANLCRKVIRDMMAAQTDDGMIPDIAPEYVQFNGGFRDSPEWGSSGIILPWYVYEWYGDKQILEESYPMMQKYISYLEAKSTNHIVSHGLGDWFDIGPKRPGASQLTPTGVTATAIYYYDLTILAKTALLLNLPEDAAKYQKLAENVRSAFNATYFNSETKQYASGSQTANAVAVYMSLVDPADKDAVIENIVKEIRARNNALSAGDIGYRYLLRVLEEAGRSDVIFDMNSRSDVPGYGWQLEHGATALTESWQAYESVSNNHLMLGHLMEWFYSGLSGIRAAKDAIAFNKVDIFPEPVGDLTSAEADFKSPYGLISSSWVRKDDSFELRVTIPVNTTAFVYLPGSEGMKIFESGRPIGNIKEIQFVKSEKGRHVYKVGSGTYNFNVNN